jgi:hypothetical protein
LQFHLLLNTALYILNMPNPIYIPAGSPEDWRQFLAEPERQWVKGYSAKELAYAWHNRNGLPDEVSKAFANSGIQTLKSAQILLAIPEHQVPLPPAQGRPTQTDLLVLASTDEGLLIVAVEGKVAEPFGPLVSEWLIDASPGKKERLAFLCDLLQLTPDRVLPIRYQLLHRTAAALIEAKRFHARQAMMLVHSFSANKAWFEDFRAFLQVTGAKDVVPETVYSLRALNGITLFCGWATGSPAAP